MPFRAAVEWQIGPFAGIYARRIFGDSAAIPRINDVVAMVSDTRKTEILRDLLDAHGELMSGRALWMALGFKGERSFQRSSQRGVLPVPAFELQGRRGRFARTRDVAAWLSSVGVQKTTQVDKGQATSTEEEAM